MLRPCAILLFLAGAMLLAACSKEPRDPCLQPRDAVARLRCVHVLDSARNFADTLLPNPLLIPIESNSSYVFGGVKRISQFPISLSELADSCRWALRPDSAADVTDTLSFYYDRELHFISNACGYTHFFQLNRVTTTKHAIDSVVLIQQEVSTDAQSEHLRIFY